MAGTVLTFQLTDKENATLKDLCTVAGLLLRKVEPAEYGKTLGALAASSPDTGAAGWRPPLPEKMIVFADVPDELLDMLLSMLRALEIGVGSYKAVLTEMNVQWTVPELFAELRREREEIEKRA